MIKRLIPFFLIIVIILVFFNTIVYGIPVLNGINTNEKALVNTKDILVENFSFTDDIRVKGIFGSYSHFFNVDENWNVKGGAYFELVFSRTNLSTHKSSTLNIFLNGQPLYSTYIYNKKESKAKIMVKLPKDRIMQGFNEITIKTYHRITDEPCEDHINPGNWLIFNKESYVHLKYTKTKDEDSIDDFPYPYIQRNDREPVQCTLLLSNNFNNLLLTPIMMMASNLGSYAGVNNFGLNINMLDNIEEYSNNNGIFIGSYSDINKYWDIDLTFTEKKSMETNTLIKEIEAPYNSDKKVLLILSDNLYSIKKAIMALGNDELIAQMQKNSQIIEQEVKIPEEFTNDDYLSFEEIGFSSINLEGNFYQSTSFDFNLPPNWKVKEGSKIFLNMRYSDLINFEYSGLTIRLNGTPISSKKLSMEKASSDQFEIEIPEDLLNQNYYLLELEFYLEPNEKDCLSEGEKNSWVYILNDSYFYIPHEDKDLNLFEYYENPFVKDKRFNNVVFVLPKNPSFNYIDILSDIIAFMSSNVIDYRDIEVLCTNELKESDKDKNLIILGTYKDKIIRDLNDNLHIQFSKNRFTSNSQITLLNNYNENLASIQLIDNPMNKERSIMVVTATDESALSWAGKYLSDSELVEKLKGNGILIDADGSIISKYFGINEKELESNSYLVKDDKEKIMTESESIKKYILIIFLIFILLTLILLIYAKRKAK